MQGADAEGGKAARDNNAELCSPRRHCSPNQVCLHSAEGLQHCKCLKYVHVQSIDAEGGQGVHDNNTELCSASPAEGRPKPHRSHPHQPNSARDHTAVLCCQGWSPAGHAGPEDGRCRSACFLLLFTVMDCWNRTKRLDVFCKVLEMSEPLVMSFTDAEHIDKDRQAAALYRLSKACWCRHEKSKHMCMWK